MPVTKSFTPTHEQESKTDESSTLLTSQKESKTMYSTTESHQKTTLESEIKPHITDSPSVSTEKANTLEGTTKDESSHTTDLTHKPTKVIPTKSRSDKHEEALTTGLTREESTEPIVKASTGTYGDKDASNNGVGSTAVYVSMRMTTEPVVQEKTTKHYCHQTGESLQNHLCFWRAQRLQKKAQLNHICQQRAQKLKIK